MLSLILIWTVSHHYLKLYKLVKDNPSMVSDIMNLLHELVKYVWLMYILYAYCIVNLNAIINHLSMVYIERFLPVLTVIKTIVNEHLHCLWK